MSDRDEQDLLNSQLELEIGTDSSANLWRMVTSTLAKVDAIEPDDHPTGLVLGYVQSGKTTAMMALMAAAVDRGYVVIIAFLGSTNLLLRQNSDRITRRLGIETRSDYRWVAVSNPKGLAASAEISGWLKKRRVIFIPVLKHAGRISDVAETLSRVPEIASSRVLIIDDEADQASLNTLVRSGAESRIYGAIDQLRSKIPNHAFIQFTATPFAPLLLEPDDPLFPRFVEFLEPGLGYTGGREFFIEKSDMVVRYISAADEQAPKKLPIELPKSLEIALWNFVIGSAILSKTIGDSTPVSMLIHPSSRKDVQERYNFLLVRRLAHMAKDVASSTSIDELPEIAKSELSRLKSFGITEPSGENLIGQIRYVLSEMKIWLLNSASASKKVDWNVSPFHILVGGNKLDRGFTVEGLTVTYMNRPSSDQIDTIEQRARAFGYRSEFLPFCQFFASARTIKMLRDIVLTEYDLRARLLDAIESGKSLDQWAKEIGFLIPVGSKPTRDVVVKELAESQSGWYQHRRPSFETEAIEGNWRLSNELGLFDAPLTNFGRLVFRELILPTEDAAVFLRRWTFLSGPNSWPKDEIVHHFERQAQFQKNVSVILMEQDAGTADARPRIRQWRDDVGFVNLFQGRDTKLEDGKEFYPGDAYLEEITVDPAKLLIEVHRINRRDENDSPKILTPAIYLGDRKIAKRKSSEN